MLLRVSSRAGLCAGLCPVTSVVSDSVTLWIVAPRLLCPWEFPGKKYWSGLPCPPPGGLPNAGIKHSSPVSSAFQVNSLLLSHQGSPGQVYRAVTMINSPSFCLSGSIFISSCLEGAFTRYVICASQIFFFQQFTYHATASVVADEKLGISLIEKSLVPKSSLLSCCCLDFVFGSWHFGCSVSQCGSLWDYLGVCWASFLFTFLYFIKFGIFLAIISSSISFWPFFLLLLWLPECIC